MEAVTGQPMPDIRFFHMGVVTIAGRQVRALRHGMVGQPGWEIFGPWEDADAVRDAIVAGRAAARYSSGRRADLSHQLSRIRLDSVAAARDLYRRVDEARIASG